MRSIDGLLDETGAPLTLPSFVIDDGFVKVGVGPQHPCLLIAEVAQAHDGSLGTAHAFIDAAHAAGAHAIKFQTHIAAEESTIHEPWRVKFSRQDDTRFAYWQRMEFSAAAWHGLAEHAREKGLLFLSTPFSLAAVHLLEKIGVGAWKVGSGEVNNLPLLGAMTRTRKPILLSSGMSSWTDLENAVAHIRQQHQAARDAARDSASTSQYPHEYPLAVFQCTTAYPCPPERWGLNNLATLASRLRCPVGLSDHSATIHAGIAAATLGASAVEVHITLSRHAFGPDVPASLTIEELAELAKGLRLLDKARTSPVDKNQEAESLKPMLRIFGKSVVVTQDVAAGTVLQEAHLAVKKPGTGIPAAQIESVVGKMAKHDLLANTPLQWNDVE